MTTPLPTKPKSLAPADLGVEEPYRTNRLLAHSSQCNDYSTAIAKCAIEAIENMLASEELPSNHTEHMHHIGRDALAKISATGRT